MVLEEAASRGLVEKLRGLRVYASSLDTLLALRRLGVEASLHLPPEPLDVYIDGADEVAFEAGACWILKGRGAAMTREKILAYNSRHVVIVVDESKLSRRLGSLGKPLPVEALPTAFEAVAAALRARGLEAQPRAGCGCRDGPAVTDNCGVVVDVRGWEKLDPLELEALLETMPGVVEHGLFTGYADEVVVGYAGGRAERRPCRRTRRRPGV